MRLPGGRGGMAAGGGVVGLIVVLAVLLLSGGLNLSGATDPSVPLSGGESADLAEECRTGDDANQREDCRIVAVVNSVQDYWAETRRAATGRPRPCFFTGRGRRPAAATRPRRSAPSTARPTSSVYIDLGFYDELRVALRRAGRAVRRGLRDRPRVRPPRAEPRSARPTGGDRREGPRAARCASSCRPTATPGVWARQRDRHRLIERAHRRGHRRRARRRRRRRRRPHPGAGHRAGSTPETWTHGSARAAPEVVHHRLPVGRPDRVRHVRARCARFSRASRSSPSRRRSDRPKGHRGRRQIAAASLRR